METTMVYWGYIGVMENDMETTIQYWGYIQVFNIALFCPPGAWGLGFTVAGA